MERKLQGEAIVCRSASSEGSNVEWDLAGLFLWLFVTTQPLPLPGTDKEIGEEVNAWDKSGRE